MRRILPIFIAVLFVTTFVGFAPIAHAQATGASAVASVASSALSGTFNVVGLVLTPLSFALAQLMSYLTMLAGVALNATVYFTIIQMAENFSKIGIETAWAAIRDVANMGFIFVLLYASIQLILGGDSGKTRHLIVNMVIAAILINFSLFFTKLIIDAANLLALTIYGAIVGPGAHLTGSDFLSSGISNGFMSALKLPELWKSSGILDGKTIFTVSVLISLIELIAAFVFAAVALLLIIRYVVLIFVLILSPIAFVAEVFPELSGPAKQWRDALVHQAFFAPLYFLLTWVALIVANGITTATFGGASLANAGNVSTFSPGLAPAFINYAVVITFLIISLVVSKNFASKAGGVVGKLTSTALGFAGGATLGLAAKVGRNRIGQFGQSIADNQGLKDAMATNRFARLAVAAGKRAGSASFDIRATGLGGALGGGRAGGQGGFKAEREADIKKRQDQAKDMEEKITGEDVEREMEARGFGKAENRKQNRSAADVEAMRRRVQSQLLARAKNTTLERQEKFLHDISQTRGITPNLYTGVSDDAEAARRLREEQGGQMQNRARFEQIQNTILAAATPADLEKALANVTTKDLEAIVETNRDLLGRADFANALSVKQLEALDKSDKLSDAEKDVIKTNRFAAINTAMAPGGTGATSVKDKIKSLSKAELEMIDPSYIANTEFAGHLSGSQIEDIQKSDKFTASQKSGLRDARKKRLTDAIAGGSGPDVLQSMGAKEIAATPITTLVDPALLSAYTPNMLKRMAQEMNTGDIQKLRAAMLASSTLPVDTRDWLENPQTGAIDFS